MRSGLAVVAAIMMLAGCTAPEGLQDQGGPGGADGTGEDTTGPGATREHHASQPVDEGPPIGKGTATFGWLLTAGPPGAGASPGVAYKNYETFEIPEGASLIRIEAEWGCVSPTCTVSVALWQEETDVLSMVTGTSATQAAGDGNLAFELQDPAAGEWGVSADSDGATAEVDGTIKWTIW